MGKSVSNDLRLWMVRGIAPGKSCREVAAPFEVAPSTAIHIQARYAATGSVEPDRQGRPIGSGKLAPHREMIIEKVMAGPDITMPGLAAWLETKLVLWLTPRENLVCGNATTRGDKRTRGKTRAC